MNVDALIERIPPVCTGAPWVAEKDGAIWQVRSDASGEVICRIAEWSEFCDQADARMIALAPELADALRTLAAENARLREALTEAEEVFSLVEKPASPDPMYHQEVKRLGVRIGFGALMHTASAGWAERAREEGYPESGTFVAGPCIGTVHAVLKRIRAALEPKP